MDQSGLVVNQAVAVMIIHSAEPKRMARKPVPKPMMLPRKGRTSANTTSGLKIRANPPINISNEAKRIIHAIILFSD